jgi:DNA polymerase I-like protein with 3'-5' exonuclease and polymerase domains
MSTKRIDLSSHIANLRKQEASKPKSTLVSDDAILFWGTSFDKNYLPHLKGCVGSATTFLRLEEITTLTTVQLYCKSKHITRVISTSPSLLKKLLHWDKKAAPSLSNYAGSYFTIPGFKEEDPEIEVVFIQPLKQLVTVPYGKFMAKRIITKLTKPEIWYEPTPFHGFDLLTPANEESSFNLLSNCFLICIDIETFRENATIRCLSYTGFFITEAGNIKSYSCVLALDSEYALAIMRKWNWQLQAPKVFQNGKYDISYLSRYNAPVYNYLYDTANLFHCWYSELPKDLGFLNSFFIREAVYWKDLAETNDLHEYYRYNALDTWGTGNCWLAMLLEAPEFAVNNYLLEFPLTFPCHLSEMTGIHRDMDKFEVARKMQQEIVDRESASLDAMLGTPEGEKFNVKSSPNMKALFKVLGCSDLKSQDEKNLKKARFRHPFNARILNKVLKIRKARTLISNYLTAGKEFSRQDGTGSRFLYSLNPHGTDSSRLASKSHHFWCGDNIQKIPRPDPESGLGYSIVKTTFKADPGFLLAEVDLEQAESRDTAYISGDTNLIQNVEHSPDFHCANASSFFGIPFEELFDIATGEKLNKKIRDIAKNVNHGANYNMGAFVLVETMGEENILKAKHLLKLPRFWSYIQVAEFLLEQFHKTYPEIKETFYPGVVEEILLTKRLTSTAVHHTWEDTESVKKSTVVADGSYDWYYKQNPSWVRHCFADPSKSKPALNSYISHPPQSLNAQTLNKAYISVFHDIANHPDHKSNFKLNAQIHDSILFQYRIGHYYLCDMVKERMEIPITIKGYDKKIRTFVVPAGIKSGTEESNGIATYWSETE